MEKHPEILKKRFFSDQYTKHVQILKSIIKILLGDFEESMKIMETVLVEETDLSIRSMLFNNLAMVMNYLGQNNEE